MTEEEQKAIEILEKAERFYKDFGEGNIKMTMEREDIKKLITLLNYISNLQTEEEKYKKELDKKDKVIEKAFKYIDEHTYRDMEECEFGETNNLTCIKDCDTCIKQYFYKQVEKVEEENE